MNYYTKEFKELEMYQKLIQYWSIIFDKRNNIQVLDNMNFNVSLYPEIITLEELSQFHQIEPGYTSPDGYTEMNDLIRAYEYERLAVKGTKEKNVIKNLINHAGVGCGNGCTNVMYGLTNAIYKYKYQQSGNNLPVQEVILILPNYTVYTAQLSNSNGEIRPKYIYGKRENGFLPLYEDIKESINDNTMAVIITYPNNPAQSTYGEENSHELKKIIKLCQENKIFLITDNIYQDMMFGDNREHVELFDLADSCDYLFKVYGSSKDTPFFSGYRTGYWIGDPCIIDNYRYYISSTENSLNTVTLTFFSLNIYFKMLSLQNKEPEVNDMKYFSNGIFGWSQIVDKEVLFEKMKSMKLYEKYKERAKEAREIAENAINRVTKYIENSIVFSDYINQNIGNVFFIRVSTEYFKGSYEELFNVMFYDAHCGILPGDVFGMQEDNSGWFRITLLHDKVENIIEYLKQIEDNLISRKEENLHREVVSNA